MVEQTENQGATKETEQYWFTLKNVNNSEAQINWAALKTNVETPLTHYPKPLDEEELLLTIETRAILPPNHVPIAPTIPTNLTKKEKRELQIKQDKLVDYARLCQHRYFYQFGRLRSEDASRFLPPGVFFYKIAELLLDLNQAFKDGTLTKWFADNLELQQQDAEETEQ